MTTPYVAQCHVATAWGPMLMRRTSQGLAGLWSDAQVHHPGWQPLPDEPDHPWFVRTCELLDAWSTFRIDPELPPLDPQGTPFQLSVWALLRTIPRGGHSSYGELARRLGDANKSRAVGAAVGRNPIGILVPCHRVLGADGSLTGFAGGLPMKMALLDAEGVDYRRSGVAPTQAGLDLQSV